MYMYIHLNNDRTLRNDNRGGCRNGVSYAPGLKSSQFVRAGQLIGYVGDSGDANGLHAHLHFEVHPNGGRAVSPYKHLRRAMHLLYPRPPSALATVSLVIVGTVAATHPELDPQLVQLRVRRVVVQPMHWIVKPARMVTLAVPTPEEPTAPSLLEAFSPGDPVRAKVIVARQNLRSARARAGVHTVVELIPR
jgi:hypothetical protein